MNSLRSTDSPPTQPGYLIEDTWSPPLMLLEAACDDVELIVDLIGVLKTDTDARTLQIRSALANSDFTKTSAEPHTIKGAARQVGTETVADACQELETVAKLQDAALASVQLNRVEHFFEVVCRSMVCYSTRHSVDHTVERSI